MKAFVEAYCTSPKLRELLELAVQTRHSSSGEEKARSTRKLNLMRRKIAQEQVEMHKRQDELEYYLLELQLRDLLVRSIGDILESSPGAIPRCTRFDAMRTKLT